jgi:hypothetical protein
MRQTRKLVRAVLALSALASTLHVAESARANGRMPGATELFVAKNDARHLVARATFGLVQSFDGGESWQWICEQAINVSGEADPPLALTADGTLVLLATTGATLISQDKGCSWAPAPELEGHKAIDLTVDPTDTSHVLVVTSTIDAIDDAGLVTYANVVFETRDNAASWQAVGTLRSDFEVETLEVAPSDPRRIYVSGTANESPLLGVIERSDDAGASWERTTLDLPPTSGSLFVSAVDPNDPDRLWVRVPAQGDRFGLFPASLLVSVDRGASFSMLGATAQGMLGFALSPDGTRVAYGGPADGLFIGPADGSGSIEKVSELRVRCLRWNADGLYACGLEPRDPFSVGVSTDGGLSFRPVYKMEETCPQECAQSTAFAEACRQPWAGIGKRIAADAGTCSVAWAPLVPSSGDAGASDAGASDAGAAPDGAVADASASDGSVAPSPDAATVTPMAMREGDGCACRAPGDAGGARESFAPSVLACALGIIHMRRRRRRGVGLDSAAFVLGALVLLVAAGAMGCGDDAGLGPQDEDAGADAASYVACPDSIPDLEVGLSVRGTQQRLEAELLDASDFPARKYGNTWRLQLAGANGDALDDVEVTHVETFMPVHGHYGRPAASFEALEEPGELSAEIHFTMRGPWEVRFEASSASAGDDLIVFDVCVKE